MIFDDIPMFYWIIIAIIAIILIILYKRNYDNDNDELIIKLNEKKFAKSTILDILKYVSKKFGDQNALNIKHENIWQSITYSEYYKKVLNFAMSVNYWLGSRTNVAIVGSNSPGWFYAHLGCMLNCGVSVGIYPTSTSEICEHIIKNSQVELLVVEDDKQLEKFVGIDISNVKLIIYYAPVKKEIVNKFKDIVPVFSLGNFMMKKNNLTKEPTLDDIATIIYTSGTTDKPKGAIITHKNIMSSVKKTSDFFSTTDLKLLNRERLISYLPLNHIAAQLIDIYLSIASINSIWFADKDALKSSLALTMKEVRPTVFMGVPRVWEKIGDEINKNINKAGIKGNFVKTFLPWKILQEVGLNECKFCITAAAPISEEVREQLSNYGIVLYDIYGMSETCGPISLSGPGVHKKGSVGRPIMDVKLSNNKEILVSGNNLFSGYYQNEKATNEATTKDKWFKTGDLGYIDRDGYLFITGRSKELIITAGGENISPILIENEIKKCFGNNIDHCVVIGDKRKYLIAILNIKKSKRDVIDEMLEEAMETINKKAQSNAHTIKKWLIVDKPFEVDKELTPTFKLRRKWINDNYKQEIDAMFKE